jgi:protein TonB
MFDLIVHGHRRSSHRDAVPIMVSVGLHSMMAALLVMIPLLQVIESIPQVPSMMAFVAAAPPPPPPPPPPREAAPPKPVVEMSPAAAPVEAPKEIVPEPPGDISFAVAGVPDGVVRGLTSLEAAPPPPAPLPPPPTSALAPVRIGGAIGHPTLLNRVGPVYPVLAAQSHVEGVVILEATVNQVGRVEDARVIRSIPLLDRAAVDAVRQWQYEPLMVNGQPARFIVTVTVTFKLAPATQPRSQ